MSGPYSTGAAGSTTANTSGTGTSDLTGSYLGANPYGYPQGPQFRIPRVIPNPFDKHVLEAEDRLLCFGKLEEMRSMIPTRPKRRAKVKKLPKEPIIEE